MNTILGTMSLLLCVVAAPLGAQTMNEQRASVDGARAGMRDQLMPAAASLMTSGPLLATAPPEATTVSVVRPGEGTTYIIVGLALFIAGLVADDGDASTVLILAGAGIGAYGLYLRFR